MKAKTGHVIISGSGEMISLDQNFCDIMHSGAQAICGRAVLDVTAPGDRRECAAAFDHLRATGTPFVITKRLIRDDGSVLWARNTVSIASDGQGGSVIVATVEPVAESVDREPARLLEVARSLIRSRHERADVCDPALFSDPGWETILVAYVAEAEGRPLTIGDLVRGIGYTDAVIGRWVAALIQREVLEIETRNPVPDAEKSFRLTAGTHERLETYLDRIDCT